METKYELGVRYKTYDVANTALEIPLFVSFVAKSIFSLHNNDDMHIKINEILQNFVQDWVSQISSFLSYYP